MEFKVNGVKQDYSMKLGEGGEAFFVFETSDEIPEALQTSPLVSPTTSPRALSAQDPASALLQEPDYLDLTTVGAKKRPSSSVFQGKGVSTPILEQRAQSELGILARRTVSLDIELTRERQLDSAFYITKLRPIES